MKPVSWIRWKYFVPLAVFVAALVVFFVFFFDPILGRVAENVGSKLNGAKVDVSGLKTKIFSGRLSIEKVQVTDPDAPMKNRFEAGPMAFQMNFVPLLKKRVLINEATLNGIGFNTDRKTSGALPKLVKKQEKEGPPSAAEKLAAKYKDRFKLNIDGLKGNVKAKIDFDPKDLQLVKAAEEIKVKAQTLPDAWQKRIDDLKVDDRLKQAETDLKSIKETPTSGPEAVTAIPANLKKLKDVKDRLDQLKKDVADTKSDIQDESKELKSDVTGLADKKKADVDDLMSRLNLDFASPDRLVEGIIGPVVLQRFQKIFHYVQLAREHMPSKKEKEQLPPKPRAKGMDIEFPTPAAPPRFWLVKAELGGAYQGIIASGLMANLTTDPSRVGKPFVLDLKGAQGARKFLAGATLDHVTDINKDSLVFEASGFDVSDELGTDFSSGQGRIETALNLIGSDGIGGQINMGLTGVKLNEASLMSKVGIADAANVSGGDKIKADFMRNVIKALEGMKEIAINAQVTGTWNDPNLKISSNLSGVLGNVIKDSVGSLVQGQRKEIEAKLNAILAEKQKDVSAKLSGIDGKAGGQLAGIEAKVQEKIAEATGINLGGGDGALPVPGVKIPSLNKLFKKK